MNTFVQFFIFITGIVVPTVCLDNTLDLGKQLLAADAPQKIFTSGIEDKEWRLDELKKYRKQLADREKQFLGQLNSRLSEIAAQLIVIKKALVENPEGTFLNKKLESLTERYQVLKDTQRSYERLIDVIEQQRLMLERYLEDPNFEQYRKELHLETHSFEELQRINHLILDQEKTIALLLDQEKTINTELTNRLHTATVSQAEFKKNKDATREPYNQALRELFDLTQRQRDELIAMQTQLYNDRAQRDSFLIEEIEYKKELIKTEIFLARSHLDILRSAVRTLKPLITIAESDISYAKDELVKKRHAVFERKELLRREIEQLQEEEKDLKNKVQELARTHQNGLGNDLDEWSRVPVKTISGYLNFFRLAGINDHYLLLQRKKELLEAQMELEDEKLHYESTQLNVKNSFYKIITRKFISDEEIKDERKSYTAPRAETKATVAVVKERKINVQNYFDQQKKALENIQEKRKQLYNLRSSLFKDHEQEFNQCLSLINHGHHLIKIQLEVMTKTLGIYGDILSLLKKITKHIDFIRNELESISIWYRPEHAISWHGIENSIPAIFSFFADTYSYLAQAFVRLSKGQLHYTRAYTTEKIPFLVKIIFLLIVLIVSRWLIGRGIAFLGKIKADTPFSYIALCGRALLIFIHTHYLMFAGWIFCFAVLTCARLLDPYPLILFYLFSIFYWLFLTKKFITFLRKFNQAHGYALLRKETQRWYLRILGTIMYASVIILFFRRAFMLASQSTSELPAILLALYVIIIQLSLISLITKEQILSLVPAGFKLSDWLYTHISRYFYIGVSLLLLIIILSNPYVGFGQLVLYILTNITYSVLLLLILFWIHVFLKQAASHAFFYVQDGLLKERFDYGKTLFGLVVIVLFLVFIGIGTIGLAKIWGWPETFAHMHQWKDVVEWVKMPLLKDTRPAISLYSLIKIVTFIFVGFVMAYIVNRFILGKIFDVLLIESGIQNTVTSLARYLIILMSFILAFQAVELGALVWYLIAALGVGIGWIIKDPIGDFIAYFIILVQRPVKIGDFITLDEETKGVVRKITPRSVVIRRKNSTTLIVPNGLLIKKPIANWNYTRGFIAFDDIHVTVTYQSDPIVVKQLLEKVLDASTFVLKSPKPVIRLEDFTEQGFEFLVRGFLSSNYTLDQWDIASDIRLEIVKTLRIHGIQLAIPMRVILHSKGAEEYTDLLKDRKE